MKSYSSANCDKISPDVFEILSEQVVPPTPHVTQSEWDIPIWKELKKIRALLAKPWRQKKRPFRDEQRLPSVYRIMHSNASVTKCPRLFQTLSEESVPYNPCIEQWTLHTSLTRTAKWHKPHSALKSYGSVNHGEKVPKAVCRPKRVCHPVHMLNRVSATSSPDKSWPKACLSANTTSCPEVLWQCQLWY